MKKEITLLSLDRINIDWPVGKLKWEIEKNVFRMITAFISFEKILSNTKKYSIVLFFHGLKIEEIKDPDIKTFIKETKHQFSFQISYIKIENSIYEYIPHYQNPLIPIEK